MIHPREYHSRTGGRLKVDYATTFHGFSAEAVARERLSLS
jgi:hypothetical protein